MGCVRFPNCGPAGGAPTTHEHFELAGRRAEGCSSRSTRNSCLKAGRDGAVRQFCLKAIDIDLAQQIKESQNSEVVDAEDALVAALKVKIRAASVGRLC